MVVESPAVDVFASLRGRLFSIAYRMLGTRADAEDIVQDAYLRWHQARHADVQDPQAWLVTVTTRLAIDRLRARKIERDAYVGPWLPEPVSIEPMPPDQAVERQSDVSLAFLAVLERLAPEERAAFLLHDVFDCGYPQIARMLGKRPAACRQMVHRARERVRRDHRRFAASPASHAQLVRQFHAALETRDEQALFALFHPDAIWTADGGGRTPAARRPITGVDRIVKLALGLQRHFTQQGMRIQPGLVNGEPSLCTELDGRVTGVFTAETDGERIVSVYVVVNPDKLRAADALVQPQSV